MIWVMLIRRDNLDPESQMIHQLCMTTVPYGSNKKRRNVIAVYGISSRRC